MSVKPNPLPDIHRFITTHSTEGESVFIPHSQIPEHLPSKPVGDEADVSLLYATLTTPVSAEDETDVASYDDFIHTPPGFTTPQGTILRMIDFHPGKETPMHRSVSVDYAVVLEGEVDLILDSGQSRTMIRGDVCVQRGTAHVFKNRSETEWCRMMFVYMPMQKLNIQGKGLEEEVYDEQYGDDSGSEGESKKGNGGNQANGKGDNKKHPNSGSA